jgi:hypothetical protein
MSEKHLENKVVILNGFSNDEIVKVMAAVKQQFENPGDLIFAKTTPNSIKMTLNELIEDLSEDHAYLKANPPKLPGKE